MDADLGAVIDLNEAAEIAGRAPVTMRRAAERGTLDARKVGGGGGSRQLWITTRDAVARYVAYVASLEPESVPQRSLAGRAGRARRARGARAP